jgi:hypothetical protein
MTLNRTKHLRQLQAMLSQVAPQNEFESLGDQLALAAHGV